MTCTILGVPQYNYSIMGLKTQGPYIRVWGLGFWVEGLGLSLVRVSSIGFSVEGLGLRG